MIISKSGIKIENTLITWEQYFAILNLMTNDQKILNKFKKTLLDVLEYSAMEFDNNMDFENVKLIAKSVGVSPTKTLEGTKRRIREKLTKKTPTEYTITRI